MALSDFSRADHTFIVSDIHLTTAEPPHPKDPLWRRFKSREFFIDDKMSVFLKRIQEQVGTGVELILAGDIFDFDGVTAVPPSGQFELSWLERRRGLNPEEPKSYFKMKLILDDHPVFFEALSKFIKAGNRLVFIIGNHDLELHWPSVQKLILETMRLTPEEQTRVRFNNWFYISNGDTLVEHGNQHDTHSNCQNPINPLIQELGGNGRPRIRLPFGCLAHRLMLNGMGYFNPHSDRTYIMSLKQYLSFFTKHLLRREPLLMWTWLWGACATLFMTIREGLALEVKDPLTIDDQVEEIAKAANSTPRVVRTLKEIHLPPMFFDPMSVLRELWLDRAFMVIFGVLLAFQLFSFLNLVVSVSFWWSVLIFVMFLPFFIFYFRSVKSKIVVDVKYYEKAVKLIAKITGVNRVVFGHTHEFVHTNFESVEYLNSGTWAPAFDDIECTKASYPQTFVWIRPDETQSSVSGNTSPRIANVFEWTSTSEMRLLC